MVGNENVTIFDISKTENMLPDSIIKRAENHIEQGMDILEAVKMAIQEENKMIESLIGNAPFLNSKGKAISTRMSKMMYENNKK